MDICQEIENYKKTIKSLNEEIGVYQERIRDIKPTDIGSQIIQDICTKQIEQNLNAIANIEKKIQHASTLLKQITEKSVMR